MGPEEDISQMEARFKDVEFHVTGIGYGMRPSKIPEVITRFEGEHTYSDTMRKFRKIADWCRQRISLQPTGP
jgi:hypothetical protein